MLKAVLVTAVIILVSLAVYKYLLFSTDQKSETEKAAGTDDSLTLCYTVTTEVSGRISMREIETYTAEKNFQFTSVYLHPLHTGAPLQRENI